MSHSAKRTGQLSRLTSNEGKALTDFVVRTGGSEEAFVEQKFPGGKPGELRLMAQFAIEREKARRLAFAFAAGESDVRLVRTRLRDEPAMRSRRGNALLEQEQFWRECDGCNEDPGTIEGAQLFKPYGNGLHMQRTQMCGGAFVLFPAGVAQELQSDMPGFRRLPAQPVFFRSKPQRDRRELVDHRSRQRYSNKQAHTKIMVLRFQAHGPQFGSITSLAGQLKGRAEAECTKTPETEQKSAAVWIHCGDLWGFKSAESL